MTPPQATSEPLATSSPKSDQANGLAELSLSARREIYAALQAGMVEAEAAFEAAKAEARRKVSERLGIAASVLDRIEDEADREGWPPWDGLADEMGPIPTFGPAKKDRRGCMIIDREESEARNEAAGRMLKVIGKITGENDGP